MQRESISLKAWENALKALKEALEAPETALNRDATIQRFEFSFELTWKTLKKILRAEGVDENTPKQVFRAAAQAGLIDPIQAWFEYLEARNLTSHTYDEKIARKVYAVIPAFHAASSRLLDLAKKRVKGA